MKKSLEKGRADLEGDYGAVRDLVENYGVRVDQILHKEVLQRNQLFKSPPYSGFLNPVLTPEMDANGEITAIRVVQPISFEDQIINCPNFIIFCR